MLKRPEMPRVLYHDRAARADLIGVWAYTFEHWGEAQAERYLDTLEEGIKLLRDDPELGRDRDALRPGYWSKRIARHVIFYNFEDQERGFAGCFMSSWIRANISETEPDQTTVV